jgi:hypothetical protein
MTPFQSWLQSRNHNGLPWETSTKELHEAFVAGWMACIEAGVANHVLRIPRGIPPQPEPGPSPEDIYAAYPRKVGKAAAIKAIKKALRVSDRSSIGMLLVVQQYAKAVATWPEGERKYIPYPASWFNAGCYDDDPKEWQRSAAAGSQFGKTH